VSADRAHASAFTELIARSYLVAPDQLPLLVAECATLLGALETTLYLVDYEQVALVPVHGVPGDDRPPLRLDATLAGNAFRRVATQVSTPASSGAPGSRCWTARSGSASSSTSCRRATTSSTPRRSSRSRTWSPSWS
jgi:hypothetical protein